MLLLLLLSFYYFVVLFYCLVLYSSDVLSCSLAVLCRYASLYFLAAIEPGDNELITLEVIHRFVELLDKYFGNVSVCVCLCGACAHACVLFQAL